MKELVEQAGVSAYARELSRPSLRWFVRLWRHNPAAVLGVALIVSWVLIAFTVPWWAPYGVNAQDVSNRLQEPSLHHLMGTDSLGRDVLSRTLLGSRTSLPTAVIVIALASAVGTALGTVSGYVGGIVDEVIMRAVDITLAFPAIVLAMAITAAMGPSLRNAMIAMVAVWWPIYVRLMRAQVLTVMPQDHVFAARAIGASGWRVMVRHVIPISLGPVVVQAALVPAAAGRAIDIDDDVTQLPGRASSAAV